MPPEFGMGAGMDEALDRFWDQEAQGHRGAAGDLDPADVAAIRHLHAYDDRPAPSSAFTRQLRESLMHAHAIQVSSGPSLLSVADGRASTPWRSGPQALPQAGGRGRWALAQAATAALLVATLVIAYFSVFRQNDEPAVIVPAVGTPTPEATPTGDWATFKGNAARDGRADAGPVGDPVQRWRFQAEGPVGPPPAVVAGVVYAGSGDGFLYALDAESGEERWRFAAGADVGGSPTVADDAVYAADGAGTLYAVETETGTERWRFASPVATASTPTVVGDLLYIGTGDGALLAIDTATGQERWRFAAAEDGAVNTPAAADGVVYVGSESGGFVAVDGTTGEERWRGDTGDDALGTAVVAEGIAYIGGSGSGGAGHLYAFDAVTGELLWQLDEALYTPAVENGVAYSASFAGTFAALDTATGAELWRIEMAGPLRPPAVADGILYVPSDGDHAVYALDAATGAELWRFSVDGGIDGAIAVADGSAYVGTLLGGVYAIGGSDGVGISGAASPNSAPAGVATPEAQNVLSGVELLWETRGGPDGFDFPRGLAIDPDGNLWVADGRSQFQIFSPDGTYLETWGEPGADNGQFNLTSANGDVLGNAAFAPDGSLYVGDAGNRRIQQFDAQRYFVAAWDGAAIGEGESFAPTSITIDTSGFIYVLDNGSDLVRVFDGEMAPVREFRIHEALGFTAEEARDSTNFIAVDGEGNVYASSYLRTAVLKFDPSGAFVAEIGGAGAGDGQFTQPIDIAFDEAGNLLVADLDSGVIEVFAPDGTHVTTWGTFGAGPGQFAGPAGIVASGQEVYVSEVDNNRVQKIRLQPLGPHVLATPHSVVESSAASGDFAGQIDIGGRSLYLNCEGEGSPTVILEAGLDAASDAWSAVMPEVAKFTRVCAYDRANTGASDHTPTPRTARDIVADLNALVTTAGVPGPYLLVASSYGGIYDRLFAHTYPEDVAGMVLIDPTHEDEDARLAEALGPELWGELVDQGWLISGEGIDFAATSAQVKEARASLPLPAVPVVLLSAGRPSEPLPMPDWPSESVDPALLALQEDLAALVPGQRWVVVEESGHNIQWEQPDVVVDAVRDVVEAVRDPSTWADPAATPAT